MGRNLERLLSFASGSIAPPEADRARLRGFLSSWNRLGAELAELLECRNGFRAIESSLQVRPFNCDGAPLVIVEWNDPATWKSAYSKVVPLEDSLFFADDVFGCQFGLRGEKVVRLQH